MYYRLIIMQVKYEVHINEIKLKNRDILAEGG